MKVVVSDTPTEAAQNAAAYVASQAHDAIRARGVFHVALSGGTTPGFMLSDLSQLDLPWERVHIYQVDERVAPDGDAARNALQLRRCLLDHIDIPSACVHLLPVTATDLAGACESYAKQVRTALGEGLSFDLIHLGLGDDGHTASLVPGDPALEASAPVALTEDYHGHRRLTLTFPVLSSARHILWLVSGPGKAGAMSKLLQADHSIPAGRVPQSRAVAFVDRAALPPTS